MALKFRRGTTAQQSGSLAFGEPYVNTTLGTLLVGGASGDIQLATAGTSSTFVGASVSASTFISGSSLKITGNAAIDGNLTLGGAITIGDATADTINVVASLSSSLVPSNDNVFNIGSTSYRYANVYATTVSASAYTGLGNLTTYSASVASATATSISTLSASMFQTDATQSNNITTATNAAAGAFTSASAYSASAAVINNAQDVKITSLQTNILSASVFTTFSTSVDSRITTEKGRVDAILSASSADKDSFAEIVTLINSVDTTNDTAFASFYTSSNNTNTAQNARLDSLEAATGSYAISSSVASATAASITSLSSSVKAVTDTFATSASVASATAASISTLSGSVKARTDQTISINGTSVGLGGTLTTAQTLAGAISSSGQVAHDSTTGYSANRHIDHTAVTLTAGSGLTGGGDISTNRTFAVGAGSYITVNADDVAVNTATLIPAISGTILSSITGDVTITAGGVATIAANSVALGTDTTGNYVASLVAGTGVTLSNNSGESATPTIAIGQSVATNATPTFGNLTINGTITATGDITAYYTSDKRHKNNIQPIENALLKVSKLNGVTWEWNDDVNDVTKATPKTGLIAQEVQEVLPEVVVERENGYLGLDYSKMMGLMVEAIKEQQTQIHNLTLEIEELKKQKGL